MIVKSVDWSDKYAGPYLGKRCVAVNDLWPSSYGGDLHAGRLRCGDDVFTATAVRVEVTRSKPVPADGRFEGEVLMPGAQVEVLAVRDAVAPPLTVGRHCVVAQVPARRVGPAYVKGMFSCDDGLVHEARAVAVRLAPDDAAFELPMTAPELSCADGRWRDCARAGGKRLDPADGPLLERACAADDPHACRDLGRWVTAYRRGETLRELELQQRACVLGSQLACFERARARNQAAEMPAWCEAGFTPACRFLQQLNARSKKDAERWRQKACADDPGCGAY